MQTDDVASATTLTIRVPQALKRRLEIRARASHRSVSAQALQDLADAIEASAAPGTGRFLGLYAAAAVPSDADIRDVRTKLWGCVTARRRRS